MKILAKYLALGAIAVILGSCSFAVGALNHKKARVVASAIWRGKSSAPVTRAARTAYTARTLSPFVAKRRVLPTRPAKVFVGSSRSVAPASSKDLSASTDIDSISYTIVNLNPGSGEAAIKDSLDPNYPYIDIYLTPGQNYRITVDVALQPGSAAATAGAAVGLGSSYGDSADIAVPADGSDVWVDLLIHPVGAIVIKNQVTGGGATMNYVDPSTGIVGTRAISAGVTTVDPHDKFLYTSDTLLYYFNYANQIVYQWPDISNAATNAVIDGVTGGSQAGSIGAPITIYAICPDPVYAGWFYVVGFDTGDSTWDVYWVNYDPAGNFGPTTQQWYFTNDATADIDLLSSTVSVTGVAADPYGFAYVTFYDAAVGSAPVSGLVEYDTYGGGAAIASFIPDTTAGWTSANSIFTDAMYGGSNVYVLASPNTLAGVGQNVGTADVFIWDIYFDQLSTNPSPVAGSFTSAPTLTAGSLSLPNRFSGLIQNGTLFVCQTNFAVTGPQTEVLSGVALDLSSVKSVP